MRLGKNLWMAAAVVVAALGATTVMTQTLTARAAAMQAAPAASRVGVVDLQRLINSLRELEDRNKELDRVAEDYNRGLDELQARLRAIEVDLKDNIPATDKRARAAKLAERMEVSTLLEARQRTSQQLFDMRRAEVIRELYNKAGKAISDMGEREGYDLILLDERSIPVAENTGMRDLMQQILAKRVLYARNTMDLTDRLVTFMNNEYAAGASRPSGQ